MFRGATKVTLDDKGRLVVPVRQRPLLLERSEGDPVVTIDRDGKCLLIYAEKDWTVVQTSLMALPNLDDRARRLQHLIMGHATDIKVDAHGRMLLTEELREFAGIERQAMFVGQGNHCELWDEARWVAQRTQWLLAESVPIATQPELGSFSL
jgi:MraZ protein